MIDHLYGACDPMKTASVFLWVFFIATAIVAQQNENDAAHKARSRAAYGALTDAEQKRVDGIRAKISDGLRLQMPPVLDVSGKQVVKPATEKIWLSIDFTSCH